ncbi:MAG: Holliday junction branch migration DNA helicase RuvB [Deltaproteobacteria bacterium]|nr:Holliday junction branch migration DNA helicase RuvB [Deltaproteobacteria bacterium]MDZ4225140.1 Holliday junction branch migration DNA helicase RuvB [bacterium]
MTDNNLLSNTPFEEELKLEISLRPKRFADFVGQAELKEKLGIFVTAAKQRKEALDHVLFSGPPGLGKTSLANILAEEMGVKITTTSGPALERPGDLAAILTNLNEHDILFIDEIHRLPRIVEEILYPAMEDFRLDLIVGQGPSAKSIQIDIPRFTLVGATTRTGLITSPLRDRFGMSLRIDYYSAEDLKVIVERSAKLLSIGMEQAAALEIGRRSRGTPRIANRLLKRVRDYAQVRGSKTIEPLVTRLGLAMLEVDEMGFDSMDRKILSLIIEKFQGGPVGVETLSSALSEEKETLEDVYEPYLLQCGFIQRTPRGRIATSLAYHHLGHKLP